MRFAGAPLIAPYGLFEAKRYPGEVFPTCRFRVRDASADQSLTRAMALRYGAFAFGRSVRISRNSDGPFSSRRLRFSRTSAGADWSLR